MTHPVPSRRASGLLCLGEFVVLDDREVAAVRHRVAERRLVAGEVQGVLRSHVRFSLFCVGCCCSCYLLAALAAGMPPMPSVVPRDTSDSGAFRPSTGGIRPCRCAGTRALMRYSTSLPKRATWRSAGLPSSSRLSKSFSVSPYRSEERRVGKEWFSTGR